jgi:hypothetical protein
MAAQPVFGNESLANAVGPGRSNGRALRRDNPGQLWTASQSWLAAAVACAPVSWVPARP